MALEGPASLLAESAPQEQLGQALVAAGHITTANLEHALQIQERTGDPLGQILLQQGMVSERDLNRVLAQHLSVRVVEIDKTPSSDEALALISESYALAHLVLPLSIQDNEVLVAVPDPTDQPLMAELRVMTRHEVRPAIAQRSLLPGAIRERYRVLPGVDQFVREFESTDVRPAEAMSSEMLALTENAPVVQVVNLLITQGLRDRASDIHIEPKKDRVRIRFRIDGVLTDVASLPLTMAPGIASRLKIMAELDIVERHRSQDGQIQMEAEGRPVDIRVSTVETIWGEKIVLRLLDKARTLLQLDELGCGRRQYQDLSSLLQSPFGMIIVSGPTGSGKTTTLYAAVNELDGVGRNIMTIEDPVEYTFENLNQVQIRKMAQINFANGLKAILRQDPDVILVGEIRDTETGEIAIQSSLTGHLVLSSLHAIDAPGVLQRLMDMGIESFLISSAVVGIVAQRLMRRICDHCREPYQPTLEELQLHKEYSLVTDTQFTHGVGCNHCAGTGYHGRIGVFEVLRVTEGVRRLITDRASQKKIRDQAVRDGMTTMRQDAVAKVDLGVTTMAEMIRSVYVRG
ncbi:MAG: ATPase, T2SS/T4P/T4SS family [Candidatus Dormiibacterota bacterium]